MPKTREERSPSRPEQLPLDWREWGGARPGAGRKKTVRSRVAHRRREDVRKYEPLHITAKCVSGLPSLRTRATAAEVMRKLGASSEREGFRLVHFSVQRDHLHLIVEADDRRSLTAGVRSLLIRVAKAVNRRWQRAGTVFKRFHEHVLRSPTEVRNAIRYVLLNARKHGVRIPANRPDPFSSGPYFAGWRGLAREASRPVTARARSWLLRTGWRQRGLIDLSEPPSQ